MITKPYKKLSFVYDFLYKKNSIFYKNYVSLINKTITENFIENPKILDIACGTGTLIKGLKINLKSQKCIIEGVDSSKEILSIAKNKNKKIKFYNQNYTSLNTHKKYNIILSTFDSINYITTIKKLETSFKKMFLHLEDKGVFIFDFNTPYKKINSSFAKKNITFINRIKNNFWIAEIYIKEGDTVYKEKHLERLYSFKEIEKILKKSGFEIKEIYQDFKKIKKTQTKNCSRLIIVAKK